MNSSKLIIPKLCLLIVAQFFTTQSLSEERESERFYVGLGLGVAQVSADFTLIDDSSRAYKAYLGYAFNEHVSVQGLYMSLGDFEAVNPFVADAQRAVANGSGFNASVVLTLPLSERFDLQAKTGVLFWRADANFENIDSSGSDMSFGIGARYRFSPTVSVGIDYEMLDFGGTDAHVGTLAFDFRF